MTPDSPVPRIKVCGLTRTADVLAAARLGVDAIGLVCFEGSQRGVSPAQAAALRQTAPPFMTTVALLVNADDALVRAVCQQVRPHLLQFHGDEDEAACARAGWPYLKAFRVGAPGLDTPQAVLQSCLAFGSASGWLFDTYHAQHYGGSGQGFDTSLLRDVLAHPDARPVILAGGLKAGHVAERIRAVRPYAVDVSSGVETSPGCKDTQAMAEFVNAVRGAF